MSLASDMSIADRLVRRISLGHVADVMGGKPCIRGLRITVRTVVGLVAAGRTVPEVLAAYAYLEQADIREALSYAAWRVEETEVPINKRSSSSSTCAVLRHDDSRHVAPRSTGPGRPVRTNEMSSSSFRRLSDK